MFREPKQSETTTTRNKTTTEKWQEVWVGMTVFQSIQATYFRVVDKYTEWTLHV